jgi:hypothetical protein
MEYLPVRGLTAALVLSISCAASADPSIAHDAETTRADSHAPLGVMGDHLHLQGEWMFSYRYMHMSMQGNRSGDERISADEIVTTQANPFFGAPMQPPTLRVVPTEMNTDMHMLGAMYAPADWLTVMVMSSYIEREMEHITYAGGAGTTELGRFTTKADGIGDTSVVGLVRLFDRGNHRAHLHVGGSLPTGSNTERDTILTPLATTPRVRLPYAMQLGSGTFDLLPGVTYNGGHQDLGWGGQYRGTLRTGDDNGYSLGDAHELSAWLSYQVRPQLSGSMRIKYHTLAQIDGIDARIAAPVQTADPDNYGGDNVQLLFGLNWAGQSGWMAGKRIAVEAGIPLLRDLNGPQMESDFVVTAGIQISL